MENFKMTKSKKPKSPLHFHGSFDELKKLIADIGGAGEWKKCTEHHYQFINVYGACFNWWPSKGTVWINGNKRAAATFRYKFLPIVSKKYQKLFHPEPNNIATV